MEIWISLARLDEKQIAYTIPDYQAFLVKQAFFVNLLFSCYLYFFIAWKTTVYCWKYREDFATLYLYLFVYFVLLHLYLVYCWKYKLVPGQRVGCNPVHASRREYRATHLNKGNMYINVRNSKQKYRWHLHKCIQFKFMETSPWSF